LLSVQKEAFKTMLSHFDEDDRVQQTTCSVCTALWLCKSVKQKQKAYFGHIHLSNN